MSRHSPVYADKIKEQLKSIPNWNKPGYKIYILLDYGLPIYVGVTKQFLLHRLLTHISFAKAGNSAPIYKKIKQMLDNDNIPSINMIEFLGVIPKEDAYKSEDYWIKNFIKNNFEILNR